ncbi:uncharacterized protein SPPG_00354 [Spizellomyces punctatus DAOM BR117]|uniref:Uncharacterized protein n=1 Tax=Spizellomyces punctatus (strain DAOM BR117) TaxID=645134 RepID=A0A0L0HU85_SPIPD|nr:uncharacterized protein SPPG_00354 [Spizellomyces punctatus DAOM BR117]KND04637.1 hypothetical protein SPPG_00354 [Spizellomyces punctatus DAOM BR117]|eukprot:XP_016612676.1 hypothetical protein SPPG_00354 [Spizellomyces punctatus DAOM BR117]
MLFSDCVGGFWWWGSSFVGSNNPKSSQQIMLSSNEQEEDSRVSLPALPPLPPHGSATSLWESWERIKVPTDDVDLEDQSEFLPIHVRSENVVVLSRVGPAKFRLLDSESSSSDSSNVSDVTESSSPNPTFGAMTLPPPSLCPNSTSPPSILQRPGTHSRPQNLQKHVRFKLDQEDSSQNLDATVKIKSRQSRKLSPWPTDSSAINYLDFLMNTSSSPPKHRADVWELKQQLKRGTLSLAE